MTKMSSKQCRSARDLLKWNVHDLASRVNVGVKRIETFERGSVQLYQNENTEIVDIFKKHGIEFLSDFEVKLKKEAKDNAGAKGHVFAGKVGAGGGGNDVIYNSDGTDSGGSDSLYLPSHSGAFNASGDELDQPRLKKPSNQG